MHSMLMSSKLLDQQTRVLVQKVQPFQFLMLINTLMEQQHQFIGGGLGKGQMPHQRIT